MKEIWHVEVIFAHYWPGSPPLTVWDRATCGAQPIDGPEPDAVIVPCPHCVQGAAVLN